MPPGRGTLTAPALAECARWRERHHWSMNADTITRPWSRSTGSSPWMSLQRISRCRSPLSTPGGIGALAPRAFVLGDTSDFEPRTLKRGSAISKQSPVTRCDEMDRPTETINSPWSPNSEKAPPANLDENHSVHRFRLTGISGRVASPVGTPRRRSR